LPQQLRLGFSASTGAATDYHDIRNVTVRSLADVSLVKDMLPESGFNATPGYNHATFIAGSTIGFRITAKNNGPHSIGDEPNGVSRIYDDLSGLPIDNITWTCSGRDGASCRSDSRSGSGPVISALWSGPDGSSAVVDIKGTVRAGTAPGTYRNSGYAPTNFSNNTIDGDSIQLDGGAVDTDLSNNWDWEDFWVVAPAISMKKSVSPQTVKAVGDVLTYTFEVTNTGSVPISNIRINETAFSGSPTPQASCPASIPAGQTGTCTATYSVTAADLIAGSITNTATATVTPQGGADFTTTPSSASVGVTANPGLTLVKTADPADRKSTRLNSSHMRQSRMPSSA
jgi:hypothetical protein